MLKEEIKKSYRHAEKQDAKYLQNMEKYRTRVHELNLKSKQKLTQSLKSLHPRTAKPPLSYNRTQTAKINAEKLFGFQNKKIDLNELSNRKTERVRPKNLLQNHSTNPSMATYNQLGNNLSFSSRGLAEKKSSVLLEPDITPTNRARASLK